MGTKNQASSTSGKAPRRPLSNEADRRRFVLRNYLSLRTRVDRMVDPMDGTLERPCMEGRWRERWEYLESCDRDVLGLVDCASTEPPPSVPSPSNATDAAPAFAGNAGLIAAVLERENKLSSICVRFIHASEEIANRPESRNYLFSAFAACEEAWRLAAGESTGSTSEDKPVTP